MPKFKVWVTMNVPRSKCFNIVARNDAQAEEIVLERIRNRVAGTNPYDWDADDPPNGLYDEDNIFVNVESD